MMDTLLWLHGVVWHGWLGAAALAGLILIILAVVFWTASGNHSLCMMILCAALAGLLLLANGLARWAEPRTADRWHPVPATLTGSESRCRTDNNSRTSCDFWITYTYRVAGQSYIGDRYGFFGTNKTGVADARARRADLTAWVHPTLPRRAVLNRETGAFWIGLLSVTAGLVLMAGAANLARLLRRASGQQRQPDRGAEHR